MSPAQPSPFSATSIQPFSSLDTVDLREKSTDISPAALEQISGFLNQLIIDDIFKATLSIDAGGIRCQRHHLSGCDEFRESTTDLIEALKQLCRLNPTRSSAIEKDGFTLNVVTDTYTLDLNAVHLPSDLGDQWILRARKVDPVPTVLDNMRLNTHDLRHLRTSIHKKRGLVSIGTPHRRYLEDWQRALCRDLSRPDKLVVSLAPRLLESIPRISQSILPPGDRWDKRLWQLASHTDADVIVLCDDGTHGYAPDQIGVLAERCLVIQILQVPNIKALAARTPAGSNIHKVLMHHPMKTLCDNCSEPHSNPSRLDYPFLDRAMPTLSDGVNAWLSASQAIRFKQQGPGCDACNQTGYSGQSCVTDSTIDSSILSDISNKIDLEAVSSERVARLMELAGRGVVCLDEVKRLT